MKKNSLLCALTISVFLSAGFFGCKKENGIDNETIIRKPYGLYISSAEGELLNTNDGETYKTLFPVDNFPARSLVTGDTCIAWLKNNLFISRNNGQNFNPELTLGIPFTFSPWQNILLSAMDQHRIYVGSTLGRGIYFTEDNGKNWFEDSQWDENLLGGKITSFTQLKNGTIYAHSNNTDSIYKKDNKTDKWSWVEQKSGLPFNGTYYLSHYNNEVIATDYLGTNGVYHSADGATWTAYTGLPTNHLIPATVAPLDEVLLVGLESMGVYRLQNGVFVPSVQGLDVNTTVWGIIGKDDIYKNGAKKHFIYLATDKGLFRSEDVGQNWIKVKEGNYVGVY